MQDLKFLGLRKNGEILSTTNRNFTTSEEADLSGYKVQDITIKVIGGMAWLKHVVDNEDFSVQLFAVADNVYIAHMALSSHIYVTESLQDCLEAAIEMIYTS